MRLLLISILSILINCTYAQDSLMYDSIHAVSIISTPYSDSDYQSIKNDNSTIQVLDAFSKFTSLHIQQNSPGGLATGLSNGMGARHLAILWDGWNIQSPINGTFDLNQLPLGLFSKSQYINKSHSSSYGTASLAGAILLDSDKQKGIHFQHLVSSTENQVYTLNINQSFKRLHVNIGLQKNNSDLKYSYLDGIQRKQQDLAEYNSTDIVANASIQVGRNTILGGKFWHQHIDRTLSPSKTVAFNGEQQVDKNTRSSFYIKNQNASLNHSIKAAYFDEYLGFFTNSIDSRAKNKVQLFNYDLKTNKTNQTSLKAQWRKDIVDTNFDIKDTRQVGSINVQQDFEVTKDMNFTFVMRQDLIDGEVSPFSFTAIFNQAFSKDWSLNFDVSKNYNLPTFNDLYWPSGGNPDLEEERSYQFNTKLQHQTKGERIDWTTTLSSQYHLVSNWILWSPLAGVWSPKNQRSVLHAGVSFSSGIQWGIRSNLKLDVEFRSSISSTQIKEDDNDDRLINKQLIYIPQHKHHLNLSLLYKDLGFNMSNTLVGKRYTSTDNNRVLPSYLLSDLKISKILLKSPDVKTWVQINNLFNQNYEVIPFYPTPLRYVSVGFEAYF